MINRVLLIDRFSFVLFFCYS